MKPYKLQILSYNQPVLIGRFMLIFSRRRVDVTNFSFTKINDGEGKFTIEFIADEWQAENLKKQVQRQIDVYESTLLEMEND